MKIPTKRRLGSTLLQKLYTDSLIEKYYFLKYCVIKNELAQDMINDTRKNEERNKSNIQLCKVNITPQKNVAIEQIEIVVKHLTLMN